MELTAAAQLGRALLDEHGLQDWRLAFDRAKRRAGVCRSDRKEIGLSGPLTALHPEAEVRDTILHEIAHALVGPRHGHDEVWRATALRIGCTGLRCSSEDAPKIDGHWVGTCPAGHRRTRHRRPQRPMACGSCSPTFDVAHLLTWTYRGRPAPMLPGYRAELDRLLDPEAKQQPVPLRLGDAVRIAVPGSEYDGVAGTLVKRGRTRYHLQVGDRVLTVPFAMVEPATDMMAP
ncbi:SprT-like domain-containing protein [Nocardioides sp. URHA0032]|uniref:SprT-like domain-containing protein n=1 Tax=Nocardioides sp. URHA0032 TaxID=1380388 RepID=UPI00049170E4|nr:SprT-like domain-containing protein [Nocardioides sp. URHA0032]